MMGNTLLYCGLAAGLDVLLGVTVAYLMLRTALPARQWLDWIATASLAVPGIVLAIGYLRLYKGVMLPGTDVLLTGSWVMIMLAYAVRRLPYALRSCIAALQQGDWRAWAAEKLRWGLRRTGEPHARPPVLDVAQSSRARASASLSSAGAWPSRRAAATISSLLALPLPVACFLIVPTGTPS